MRNEQKWTPGPWVVHGGSVYDMRGNREFPEFMRAGKQICRPCDKKTNTYKKWSANAHLIAAAPDVYEKLEKLVERVEQMQYDHNTSDGDLALDEARAALAKARGEKP